MNLTKEQCRELDIPILMMYASECRGIVEKSAISGTIDEETLQTLENIANEVIEFTKMYLISSVDRFYGIYFLGLNISVDFSISAPAAVSLSKPYSMMINPLRWIDVESKTSYEHSDFIGDVIHEILHLVFGHPADLISNKNDYSHTKLNIAADAAVNDVILDEIKLDGHNKIRLTKDVITSTKVKKYIEEYLFKKLNKITIINVDKGKDIYYYLDLLELIEDDEDISKEYSDGNFNSEEKGFISTILNESEKHHSYDNDGLNDASEIRQSLRNKTRDVWQLLSIDDRKAMSLSMRTKIETLLKPEKLGWVKMFERYSGSLPTPYRNTRTRPSRMQPYRYDIPGKLPKYIVDVVIAIDTSASMTEEELKYIISEISHILKGRNYSIEIIECDTQIVKIYSIDRFDKFDYDIKGGGGTQFSPVFEHMIENRQRYQDSLLVYFTDGHGEDRLSVKPINNKILWVITDGPESQLSVREPYGEIRSLMDDKKFTSLKN